MYTGPNPDSLISECTFQASRSSGAGGQHVNKVNTRVELRWDLQGSDLLTPDQKLVLKEKLASKMNKEGELIIVSEKTRSQLRNREDCVERFRVLIFDAFRPVKKRIPTRASRRSRENRLQLKKKQSEQKQQRRKPEW